MKTILIIDDDAALTQRNHAALTLDFKENARILTAYTAERVLELAKAYYIDAFVIDIFGISKDMDGVELAEVLRKEGYPYPVPIIITSEEKNDTFKSEVHKRIKFYDYITKPYGEKELVGQVKSAVKVFEYQLEEPSPYFEIEEGNSGFTYRVLREQISHIEKIYDKRMIEIKKRDENGNPIKNDWVSIQSFKDFVSKHVESSSDFIQCNRTTVVSLYWVERYSGKENCVILRECGTKIPVGTNYRKAIKKLVPLY